METIQNLEDYIGKVTKVSSDKKYFVFFRGEIKDHKKLLPSIYHDSHSYIEHEDTIFKEIIAMYPNEMLEQKTTVEKLILMQHYGFPTRLLDITKNPLIALFFSCFEKDKKPEVDFSDDGKVFQIKIPKDDIKYCDSDTISVIANLCKRPSEFKLLNVDEDDRDGFNEMSEIGLLLHEIKEEKPYFLNWIDPKHINSVQCLRPRLNNQRIIRQDGYFLVFGINNYNKKECANVPSQWEITEYSIPQSIKKEIVDSLDLLNINETFVYPEYESLVKKFDRIYKK